MMHNSEKAPKEPVSAYGGVRMMKAPACLAASGGEANEQQHGTSVAADGPHLRLVPAADHVHEDHASPAARSGGTWFNRISLIISSNLPAPQRMLLLVYASHADSSARAYPGDELLALEAGMSEANVRRVREKLKGAGIIIVEDARANRALRVRLNFAAINHRAATRLERARTAPVSEQPALLRASSPRKMRGDDLPDSAHHAHDGGASPRILQSSPRNLRAGTIQEKKDHGGNTSPPPPTNGTSRAQRDEVAVVVGHSLSPTGGGERGGEQIDHPDREPVAVGPRSCAENISTNNRTTTIPTSPAEGESILDAGGVGNRRIRRELAQKHPVDRLKALVAYAKKYRLDGGWLVTALRSVEWADYIAEGRALAAAQEVEDIRINTIVDIVALRNTLPSDPAQRTEAIRAWVRKEENQKAVKQFARVARAFVPGYSDIPEHSARLPAFMGFLRDWVDGKWTWPEAPAARPARTDRHTAERDSRRASELPRTTKSAWDSIPDSDPGKIAFMARKSRRAPRPTIPVTGRSAWDALSDDYGLKVAFMARREQAGQSRDAVPERDEEGQA